MQRKNETFRSQEKVAMKDPAISISTKIIQDQFNNIYDISAEIGRGKFAVVKRCVHKPSGVEYAAKFLKKRRKGKDCKKDVLHEVHMLELAFTHPRIISLVEVYETVHDLIIVTHFARGGELFEYINTEGQLEEKVTVRLMQQILDAVSFLHKNNIAHLDVKPQNILLTESLPKGDIKLCDFGLARLTNCGHDILEIIGTPDYVAPEVLDYKPLDSACDLWSIGVLTYVMLTGCSPFAGDTTQETYLNISQVNLDFPEELFDGISKEAIDFMQCLLLKNPPDRMTAHQGLDHVWLQKKDPVIPTVESPAGQRRSVMSTQNPDFHKPVKKSRCDLQSADKENFKCSQISDNSISCARSRPISIGKDECFRKVGSFDVIKPILNDSVPDSVLSENLTVKSCDEYRLSVSPSSTVCVKENLELVERRDLPEVTV